MSIVDLLDYFAKRGFEVHGRCRGKSGVCYLRRPSVLDSVLDFFEQRKLINGAYGSSGIKITADGEVELERLQSISQESRAEPEKSIAIIR